jgi:hypothetical protein
VGEPDSGGGDLCVWDGDGGEGGVDAHILYFWQ